MIRLCCCRWLPKCGREFRLRKYGSWRMVLLTSQASSLDQRNIIKCGHIRVARVNIEPHTFTPWIPPGTLFVIIYWTMGQIHTSLSTQHPRRPPPGMRLLMTTDTVQWVLLSGGRHGCLPCWGISSCSSSTLSYQCLTQITVVTLWPDRFLADIVQCEMWLWGAQLTSKGPESCVVTCGEHFHLSAYSFLVGFTKVTIIAIFNVIIVHTTSTRD